MPSVILIAHNLRSTLNVGALLRTAEGLGVEKVYLTGYTPYPSVHGDTRLPHIARKLTAQIHKTALGAEDFVRWEHRSSIGPLLAALQHSGYRIAALEQDPRAIRLPAYRPPEKVALAVGREIEGVEPEVLAQCDDIIEIPMAGKKESFNVSAAAAMVLYQFIYPHGSA